MTDYAVIYLAPECQEENDDGRTWALDCPFPECECPGSPHKPVKYVLATAIEELQRERDEARADCAEKDRFNDDFCRQMRMQADRATKAEAQLARQQGVIEAAKNVAVSADRWTLKVLKNALSALDPGSETP